VNLVNTIYLLKDFDKEILKLISENSSNHGLILMQDAVLLTVNKKETSIIEMYGENGNLYALKPDALKRGITDKMVPGVQLIDHDELVDMLFSGAKILNL